MAFFPCIYFCAMSQINFSWTSHNYRKLDTKQKTEEILKRSDSRNTFFKLAVKMFAVVYMKNIRMIMENPWSEQTFLKSNFIMPPTFIDKNRMLRGDYFVKPTAYWFLNCEPTYRITSQNDKKKRIIQNTKPSNSAGMCSEERSMISPDYARNFICDFVIGKGHKINQLNLF